MQKKIYIYITFINRYQIFLKKKVFRYSSFRLSQAQF